MRASSSGSAVGPCVSCSSRGVQCFCAIRAQAIDSTCLYGQTFSSQQATLGTLVVEGPAVFLGSVTGVGPSSLSGDLVLANLEVTETLQVDGTLSALGPVVIAPPPPPTAPLNASPAVRAAYAYAAASPALTVVGDTTFTGGTVTSQSLVISGTAVFDGSIVISGGGSVSLSGVSSLSVSGPLDVSGLSTLAGGAVVGGALAVSGTSALASVTAGVLAVSATSYLLGGVNVGSPVIPAGLNVTGNARVAGGLSVSGPANVYGTLSAPSLSVSGVSALSSVAAGGLNVSGTSSFVGFANFSFPATFNSLSAGSVGAQTLTVAGAAVLSGGASAPTLSASALSAGSLVAGGAVVSSLTAGALAVSGTSTFLGSSNFQFPAAFNSLSAATVGAGGLTVSGASILAGGLSTTSAAVGLGGLSVSGPTTLYGAVTAHALSVSSLAAQNLSLSGILVVAGTSSLASVTAGSLNVSGTSVLSALSATSLSVGSGGAVLTNGSLTLNGGGSIGVNNGGGISVIGGALTVSGTGIQLNVTGTGPSFINGPLNVNAGIVANITQPGAGAVFLSGTGTMINSGGAGPSYMNGTLNIGPAGGLAIQPTIAPFAGALYVASGTGTNLNVGGGPSFFAGPVTMGSSGLTLSAGQLSMNGGSIAFSNGGQTANLSVVSTNTLSVGPNLSVSGGITSASSTVNGFARVGTTSAPSDVVFQIGNASGSYANLSTTSGGILDVSQGLISQTLIANGGNFQLGSPSSYYAFSTAGVPAVPSNLGILGGQQYSVQYSGTGVLVPNQPLTITAPQATYSITLPCPGSYLVNVIWSIGQSSQAYSVNMNNLVPGVWGYDGAVAPGGQTWLEKTIGWTSVFSYGNGNLYPSTNDIFFYTCQGPSSGNSPLIIAPTITAYIGSTIAPPPSSYVYTYAGTMIVTRLL